MKTLVQHIEERLLINKDFKPLDTLDTLDEIKNVEWRRVPFAGKMTENIKIFDKFVEYIRETNPKEISCRDAARRVNKDKYLCGINTHKKIMILYHKSDAENDLFEKITICFVNQTPEVIQFACNANARMLRSAIAPLNTSSAFFSSGKYYQYEISKETFDELVNLYEEL